MSIQKFLRPAQPGDQRCGCRCKWESPAITRDRSPWQFDGLVAKLPDSAKKSAKSYRKSFAPRPTIHLCPGILTFLPAPTSWSPEGLVLLAPPSPDVWLS